MPEAMRGAFSIGTAFWLVACESAWSLDLSIRVPARRQAEFTGYPAQLVLVTDTSAQAIVEGAEGRAERIANLCSPKDEDFVVTLSKTGNDCAALPRYVEAWLEAREPGAESKCGAFGEPTPLVGLRHPGPEALRAEATVFEDHHGDCDGLRAGLTLRLDW